jgi:hypothetical protein
VTVRRFRSPGRLIHGHMADRARVSRGAYGCFSSSMAIPMIWNKRPVKPSAQPTLVRTQHLPLPRKRPVSWGAPGFAGRPVLCHLVSSCVIVGQQTSLCGSGYGHMADGIRAEGAVHRTACSGCADAPVARDLAQSRVRRGCRVQLQKRTRGPSRRSRVRYEAKVRRARSKLAR